MYFLKNSGKMEWNEKRDIILCHEVLQMEPYKAKEKTVGRAQAWEKIANTLNKRAEFKVTKKSLRDHYMVLVEKFKRKTSQELRASGISPEPTVQCKCVYISRSTDDVPKFLLCLT